MLRPKCTALGECIVNEGDYGQNFILLLSGTLRIRRPANLPEKMKGNPVEDLDYAERDTSHDTVVLVSDREPMVGFAGCLTQDLFDYVSHRTGHWAVDSTDWSDTLWVSRKSFLHCFEQHWRSGQSLMEQQCFYHYQIEALPQLIDAGLGPLDAEATPMPTAFMKHVGAVLSAPSDTIGGEVDTEAQLQAQARKEAEEREKERAVDPMMQMAKDLAEVKQHVATLHVMMERMLVKMAFASKKRA